MGTHAIERGARTRAHLSTAARQNLAWFVGGLAFAFLVPFAFADTLDLPRDVFYGIYVASVLAFFLLWAKATGQALGPMVRRRWMLAVGLGLVLIFSVTRVVFVPFGDVAAFAALSLAAFETNRVPPTIGLVLTLALIAVAAEVIGLLRRGETARIPRAVLGWGILPALPCLLAWAVAWRGMPQAVYVVAAVLPDPATIGPRMEGKTCAGLFVTGTGKDGRPRRTYLYHVSDNADTMRDYDAQCVVWQTAVNPVVALELLAAGTWSGAGVLGPEAFDAVPFLDLLAAPKPEGYGSPWGLEDR